MSYYRKLGIFVRIPESGTVKTRLVPPLADDDACALYEAFLRDLFCRLERLKKVAITVFVSGGDPSGLRDMAPERFVLVGQEGRDLGERMKNAFDSLLDAEGDMAVIIGSDSPDLPLAFIKRAFLKLKHKEIVLGPASDGGYYLIGLKRLVPRLFDGVDWGTGSVLEETLRIVHEQGMSGGLLPLWYDVDDVDSLALLRSMLLGRRIERRDRLRHTERVMNEILSTVETKHRKPRP
jgi:rSAM/selenodomain-associated transferase 1